MVDLRVTVLCDLTKYNYIESMEAVGFPDGVQGGFQSYSGETVSAPEGKAVLMITDNAGLTAQLVKEEADRVYVVFVGDIAELADIYDSVYEVWNPVDSAEVVKFRFRRLIKRLKDEFDLWFYKQTLLATIDSVPDMLWYKRIDGIHMLVNDAFTEIVHKPKSDIHGKDHFYIWDVPRPDDSEEEGFACEESEEIAISTGKTYIGDEAVKTREGMKQLTTYKTPIYDMYGNVFGTVGVGHDVTNFSNLGIELSILIENLPFPMTIFSPDWKVVRMNSYFKDIVGAEDVDSFDYQAWKDAVPVPLGGRKEDPDHHSVSGEYQIEVEGEPRRFIHTELVIRDYFDNITGYFCTMRDITYQRAYEQSIIKAANTDMLTGMYNRRYFYNFLNNNIGRAFHLLYLDLDNFKKINDSYGHKVGDEVLIKTAEMIREQFPNAVTARLGGDEFAVVDESGSRSEIQDKCGRLETQVQEAFGHYNCGLSISIGITETDGSMQDIDRLLNEGDVKMYEVKREHHRRENG